MIQPYPEGSVAPSLVAGANQKPANLTNFTPTTYTSHVRSYIQLAATRLSITVISVLMQTLPMPSLAVLMSALGQGVG